MKPTEPKPVKAWAVVDETGEPDAEDLFGDEGWANLCAEHWGPQYRVIPVTIVPGHEAADLILAGLGRGPMKKSPLREAKDA